MQYTVKQLAKLANISSRTLHYYDEIGLLKPSFVKDNRYRCYEEKELLKLQQILFFKELEFPLEDIISMMHAPKFDTNEALREQKKLLELKRTRINRLLATIDKTISQKGGDTMKTNDLFDSFDDVEMNQYKDEAKKRWGHTEAYKQSLERTKHWTKTDYKKIAEDGKVFTQKLANAMDKPIESKEVQELIAQHHKGIETFYDCSTEMYRGLGQLYVTDPRFTAFYENFRPGLAAWMNKAISFYCDKAEKE